MPTKIKEGWEYKLEDEMRFLHQDGYASGWAEMKKNAIKDIVSLATSEAKREEREKIVGIVRGMKKDFNPEIRYYYAHKVLSDPSAIDGYNLALSDIASSLESSLGDKEKKI